jgi:hypothetical protein
MRLVVEFTTGDGCNESWDHVVPFEYESAEKLLVDLEDGWKTWTNETAIAQAKIQAHPVHAQIGGKKRVSFTDKDMEEWRALFAYRSTIPYKLTSGTSELSFGHFEEGGKFYAPRIYTVDEWFGVYGM